MADISDINSALPVKIIGNDATGVEQTPVQSTSNGGLHINLRNNAGVESGTLTNPVIYSSVDSLKQTYSASFTGIVAANNPTDVFTLTGSGTKTIRINRIIFSGTQNTSTSRDILLVKRSTANTGGTSTTATNVSHDSTNAAGTATIRGYTVNPTLGTIVGTIRSRKIQLLANNVTSASDPTVWTFGDINDQSLIVRGTGEVIALNLNGVTSSNSSLNIVFEWTEE